MDSTVDRTHNYSMTVCPHCQREVPTGSFDMHASVCIFRPDMQERIKATLASDEPGVGARLKDYDRKRAETGAAHSTTLMRVYGGTWAAVLDAFGLTPWMSATKRASCTAEQQRMTAKQREQAACDDVAAMCEDARRLLAAEYDNAHTFHGYRVRDLPGVTVNGHKCVAVMLR